MVDLLRRAEGSVQTTSLPRSDSRRAVPWRALGFGALLVSYVLVTLGVVYYSPLLDLDHAIKELHLQRQWHGWYHRVEIYVMLGQRAPSTLLALPWIAWCAWRERSPRPLVLLATALFVLNLSVGIVKMLTGRIGPLATSNVHEVFAGGNIYPSGHVSNTVVLYGVIAMLAHKHRKLAVGAAVFITTTVGLLTLYLNTHWFTDVIGGWLAGSLVLVSLPWLMPYTERATEAVIARFRAAHRRRRLEKISPPVDEPVPESVLVLSGQHRSRSTIDAR